MCGDLVSHAHTIIVEHTKFSRHVMVFCRLILNLKFWDDRCILPVVLRVGEPRFTNVY